MNVSNYVNQLTEDIENLLQCTPPYLLYDQPEDFEEQMEKFEDHVLNSAGVWICDYSGIQSEFLPREDLLSEGQLELLVSSLTLLMDHYNFHPVFPDALPDRDRYKKIREEWHKFKAPLISCDLYYEFCEYDEEHCPFPGYCDSCQRTNDIIEEGKYICGIFNYCDRWCEKCDFSSKCSVKARGAHLKEVTTLAPHSDKWVMDVESSFAETQEMIQKKARNLDISALEIAKNDGFEVFRDEELNITCEGLQLKDISEYYAKSVHEWLCDHENDPLLNENKHLGVVETIAWYHTIIAAKLFRALMMVGDEYSTDIVQNDSNGSAKVVLYCIRQSSYAWTWVLQNHSKFKDTALKQLILLQGLQVGVEEQFPRAEEFVRPGFDQEEFEWE
ncbi:MAG: hypothetical protein PF450_14825 [Bacteroidales bacterium]|jgi:hypothetical protein|nr:hypothetical protein [Bacteroidales bacterium]